MELEIVKGKHKREIPIIGIIFGENEIISNEIAINPKSPRKSYWKIRCNRCKNEYWVRSDIFKSGQSTKCRNCANKDNYTQNVKEGKLDALNYSIEHKGVGDLSKILYYHYLKNAEKRNIEFNISIEYLWNLFIKQGNKCALSGIYINLRPEDKTIPITIVKNGNRNINWELFNASLDRIDSSKGYIEGNVQWVERQVNICKHILSNQEFINLCKKIVNHVNQQPS